MKTLVTDPCYIISDKDWQEMCVKTDAYIKKNHLGNGSWSPYFEKLVQKRLRQVSRDKKAVVGGTGFGDWTNKMVGQEGKILTIDFYADSGMVCVVKDTDQLKGYMNDNNDTLPLGGASILDLPKTATYKLDYTNPHWTVVTIFTRLGELIARSLTQQEWEEDLASEAEEEE